MFAAVRVGHQDVDVVPDYHAGGVTEHSLGGRVEGLDDASFVDDDDGIDGGGEDGLRARLAVPQGLFSRLAFGGRHGLNPPSRKPRPTRSQLFYQPEGGDTRFASRAHADG